MARRIAKEARDAGRVRRGTESLPLVVGTGLLALDVVIGPRDSKEVHQWCGGTCGNVVLILQYLGWRSVPVARLGRGDAAARLLDDLKQWGLSTAFVSVAEDGATPVIVHRIRRSKSGEPYHTFSWRCPNCGGRLPGYKPVLASVATELLNKVETPQVFFFDRVSRAALVFARAFAARGAAVVFEPSAVGNPVLFKEAWGLADIVKYSHERLHDLPADMEDTSSVHLQIETLGREGLRYRNRLSRSRTRTWQRLEAFTADNVLDTAGAGDWCTAGIVSRLLMRGRPGLSAVTDSQVREAMRYGQALASWNCGFEGARGGMYSVSKDRFQQEIARILSGRDAEAASEDVEQSSLSGLLPGLCRTCDSASTVMRKGAF